MNGIRTKQLSVYDVLADKVTGEWWSHECTGETTTQSVWLAQDDTDYLHFDTAEIEISDDAPAQTVAVRVHFVEPIKTRPA